MLPPLVFDNRFVRELPGDTGEPRTPRQVQRACWSTASPTPVRAPRLLAGATEVAALFGLSDHDLRSPTMVSVLGGNTLLDGMRPYASCYGGHQFGNWAGQLGDGRAINLGEVVNAAGERWELQLKGAGPTPYSRSADGRAVLRSSIREFLCSEAMHHLGVPTTRALSLVATGDQVLRDMFYSGDVKLEPGAIVCRVAPSFIRFGHFELPASRGDIGLLRTLVNFTIDRDFPHLQGDGEERIVAWMREVSERTAQMIVHWMRVGFVHGVMNTDNMSIVGLTIDYGPYGWLDSYDPNWTPNTTDAGGRRYRYGHQPAVAQWNLVQLATAIAPLLSDTAGLQAALDHYASVYRHEFTHMTCAKFGFTNDDDDAQSIITEGYRLLEECELDHTNFFRTIADLPSQLPADEDVVALLDAVVYDPVKVQRHHASLEAWLRRWHASAGAGDDAHVKRRIRMHAVNPRYVFRNYLAQQAIDKAEQGDDSMIMALLDLLRRPYDEQPANARFAMLRPEWARNKAGASMLSCSS